MVEDRNPRGALRRKILEAGFREFYTHGFQGGSVNRIIDQAGTTKGALFHHFANKEELGYAVVEEVIAPLMKQRWILPVSDSIDIVTDFKAVIQGLIRRDIQSGSYLKGCPLNNLAQEMSPLDEKFRLRIDAVYGLWRESLAAAFGRAVKLEQVKKDLVPDAAAAFIVAAQMGIWGSAKTSRDPQLMRQAGEVLCGYLEHLRRETPAVT